MDNKVISSLYTNSSVYVDAVWVLRHRRRDKEKQRKENSEDDERQEAVEESSFLKPEP